MTRKHPEIGNLPDYKFGDKVRILQETRGFMPMTKQEATVALQVMPDSKIDAARYLNEILQHQRNNGYGTDVQQQAVRSASRTLLTFYNDASRLRQALLNNYHLLSSLHNPYTRIDQISEEDEGLLDPRGVLAITRTNEITTASKLPSNGERQLRAVSPEGISGLCNIELPLMMVELEMSGIEPTVRGIRDETFNVGTQQRNRRDFWFAVASDAQRHAIAYPVVHSEFSTKVS